MTPDEALETLREAHRRCVIEAAALANHGSSKKLGDAQDAFDAALDTLVAERDRYKAALEDIIEDHGPSDMSCEPSCPIFKAQAALSTDQEATDD